MQSVVMGKKASQSLMRNLEQMVVEDKPKQFFIFKDGDTTYTFQKCSNTFGQYLELKVGGRRRSVIIPEVKEKRGWSLEPGGGGGGVFEENVGWIPINMLLGLLRMKRGSLKIMESLGKNL